MFSLNQSSCSMLALPTLFTEHCLIPNRPMVSKMCTTFDFTDRLT